MKIYVGHSTDFDFEGELYKPLKNSSIAVDHTLVFPYEDSDELFDSRSFLQEECDLFVAEVSRASTGLGIELGWADQFDVPIICVCREGSDPSGALKTINGEVREYDGFDELVGLIEDFLEEV